MTPTDVALLALVVICVVRLAGRGSLPRPALAPLLAAAAFSGWLLLSSALNGLTALVAAAKLLEYGALALGLVLFVRRREQLWVVVGLIAVFAVAATTWGVLAFFGLVDADFTGRRQPSFRASTSSPSSRRCPRGRAGLPVRARAPAAADRAGGRRRDRCSGDRPGRRGREPAGALRRRTRSSPLPYLAGPPPGARSS